MSLPGFVDCPTCEGTGATWKEFPCSTVAQGWDHNDPCPDCVDGQVPSPETVERVARSLCADDGIWNSRYRQGYLDAARAALLEYARHVQDLPT